MSTILDALRKAQANRPTDADDEPDSAPAVDRSAGETPPLPRPEEFGEAPPSFDDVAAPGVGHARRRSGAVVAAGVAIAGLALGAAGARFVTGGWNPFAAGEQLASVAQPDSAIVAKGARAIPHDAASSVAEGEPSVAKSKRARDTRKGSSTTPQPTSEPAAAARPEPGVATLPGAPKHADSVARAPATASVPPLAPQPTKAAMPATGEDATVATPIPMAAGSPSAATVPPGMPPVAPLGLTRVPAGPVGGRPPVASGVALSDAPPSGKSAVVSPVAALPSAVAPGQVFDLGAPEPGSAQTAPVPGAPSAGTVLETAPTDAPEVSLLFIKWSRDLGRRVASLRGPGGKLMLVHEGDIIEGMRVASIRPDAVELQWRGTNFLLLAAR